MVLGQESLAVSSVWIMSAAKAKGTAAETAVVNYLIEHGYPHAERRALNGALDKGDITGVPCVCIEVKAAKNYKIPEWLRETAVEKRNAKADVGVLVIKPVGVGVKNAGDFWAVMPLSEFADLLRDAGYGNPRVRP